MKIKVQFKEGIKRIASRASVPVEIISKIILRHANLTTQLYLGKISDTEAIRSRIENLYA